MEDSTATTYTKKVANTFNKAFDNVKSFDTAKLIRSMNENMIIIVVNILLVIAIALMIWNYDYNRSLESTLCEKMLDLYPEPNNRISSMSYSTNTPKDAPNNFEHSLYDYYIKTAYNACSPGNYRNSAVSTCALKDVLSQGARCLDFEIYSMNDKPVVATSMDKNFYVKETFNAVDFGEALSVITDFGFASESAPNPKDPIIIHLRINSENPKMFGSLARLLKRLQKEQIVLPVDFSIAKLQENFAKIPVFWLLQPTTTSNRKMIIVMIDKTNPSWLENQELRECVNIVTNSVFARCLRYTKDVKETPDMEELKTYNKHNLTIVLPDDKNNPDNPGSVFSRSLGCQMVAMRYQTPDPPLKEDNDFFSNNAHAFVLKPKELRYIPVYKKIPPPPNEKLSYKPRDLKSKQGLYDFEV